MKSKISEYELESLLYILAVSQTHFQNKLDSILTNHHSGEVDPSRLYKQLVIQCVVSKVKSKDLLTELFCAIPEKKLNLIVFETLQDDVLSHKEKEFLMHSFKEFNQDQSNIRLDFNSRNANNKKLLNRLTEFLHDFPLGFETYLADQKHLIDRNILALLVLDLLPDESNICLIKEVFRSINDEDTINAFTVISHLVQIDHQNLERNLNLLMSSLHTTPSRKNGFKHTTALVVCLYYLQDLSSFKITFNNHDLTNEEREVIVATCVLNSTKFLDKESVNKEIRLLYDLIPQAEKRLFNAFLLITHASYQVNSKFETIEKLLSVCETLEFLNPLIRTFERLRMRRMGVVPRRSDSRFIHEKECRDPQEYDRTKYSEPCIRQH